MAPDVFNLTRRAVSAGLSETMTKLLVALMVLLIVAVLLVGALLILRQRRKTLQARGLLPQSNNNSPRRSTSSVQSWHRRVSARPSQSIHVFREKQIFEESSDSPPSANALPEIRITFPEEIDSTGKRQSGHVVVVRVGDSSFGLEPMAETLPPYQQSGGARFQSIDLERMGGLVEKKSRPPLGWS